MLIIELLLILLIILYIVLYFLFFLNDDNSFIKNYIDDEIYKINHIKLEVYEEKGHANSITLEIITRTLFCTFVLFSISVYYFLNLTPELEENSFILNNSYLYYIIPLIFLSGLYIAKFEKDNMIKKCDSSFNCILNQRRHRLEIEQEERNKEQEKRNRKIQEQEEREEEQARKQQKEREQEQARKQKHECEKNKYKRDNESVIDSLSSKLDKF